MKILGIGSNYVTDLKDIEEKKKAKKFIFSKPSSSLAINRDVEYPSITNQLIYEVELVIKIGKEGKNIAKKDANSYISEIAVGIDYTAKDLLSDARETKHPWEFAKGFDGAAPISSFKSITEYPNLADINFDLKINEELKQESNTAYMINDFADIIVFISEYMTLQPGDLIFTGTPALGKGEIFKGDQLQCSINGELMLDFKMI
ncbi:2-keto-4-pentenoate hydratase/2-oxohepta-3-ene-1,7-dioic acid hydratase in catechol pathway [Lutibacter sp. Hel_I_33_5]|uniref:fumarylacetoacetate hydrolase family protein n=1 Tax=Lutibacter sp. Hel_I_33_5 TaxID=1566289 RepID=UPI0011A7C03F|nr:fumarylacetoacetate hydrolase family protein [Lutibacter sp. Hel_I_33_5]TVZ55074.1 2-keto-4-pentenoate hydratase/2-oxohepta-3-ene-1,7-dioic acid hydratase in catechol pathway [Lutibacter sp. Hel_I_33_5]